MKPSTLDTLSFRKQKLKIKFSLLNTNQSSLETFPLQCGTSDATKNACERYLLLPVLLLSTRFEIPSPEKMAQLREKTKKETYVLLS